MNETHGPSHPGFPRPAARSDLQEALAVSRISPAEWNEAVSVARGLYPDDLVLELDRHLAHALEVEEDPNRRSQIRRAADWVRDGANKTAIEIIAKVIAELIARQAGM